MVADEIGHASVVMTEKYAKCNLRRLQDDFPSLADRIALRLVPPTEDVYFKNLLQIVWKWHNGNILYGNTVEIEN